jgi:hypothetical protein
MSDGPGISYMDYYVPETRLSVSDFVNRLDNKSLPPQYQSSAEYAVFLETVLELDGIPHESKYGDEDMLGMLIEKMFQNYSLGAEDIDMIVLAIELKVESSRNPAHWLQFRYG